MGAQRRRGFGTAANGAPLGTLAPVVLLKFILILGGPPSASAVQRRSCSEGTHQNIDPVQQVEVRPYLLLRPRRPVFSLTPAPPTPPQDSRMPLHRDSHAGASLATRCEDNGDGLTGRMLGTSARSRRATFTIMKCRCTPGHTVSPSAAAAPTARQKRAQRSGERPPAHHSRGSTGAPHPPRPFPLIRALNRDSPTGLLSANASKRVNCRDVRRNAHVARAYVSHLEVAGPQTGHQDRGFGGHSLALKCLTPNKTDLVETELSGALLFTPRTRVRPKRYAPRSLRAGSAVVVGELLGTCHPSGALGARP